MATSGISSYSRKFNTTFDWPIDGSLNTAAFGFPMYLDFSSLEVPHMGWIEAALTQYTITGHTSTDPFIYLRIIDSNTQESIFKNASISFSPGVTSTIKDSSVDSLVLFSGGNQTYYSTLTDHIACFPKMKNDKFIVRVTDSSGAAVTFATLLLTFRVVITEKY